MPKLIKKTRNQLLVSVTPGMRSAYVAMTVHPVSSLLSGRMYRTRALIDSGSTNTVLGKKAWRAFGLDKPISRGKTVASTLRRGQTMTASGRMMSLFYLPVMIHVAGRAPFRTSIALQNDSDLDVLGFTEMAKGDIQLR
jgi:hypothetical protein